MAFRKKTYGQYKTANCAFCGKIATQKNETGLDVCRLHIQAKLEEIKCTCGSWLDQRVGKFGPYFNCINCGNFNFDKAMQIKELTTKKSEQQISQTHAKSKQEIGRTYPNPSPIAKKEKEHKKEITITSDDAYYFS